MLTFAKVALKGFNMQEIIKNIVAQYTKIPADSISLHTKIDRSAMAGSIVVHRMYAALAKAGVSVPDYAAISTYGDLQAVIDGKDAGTLKPEAAVMYTPSSSIEAGNNNHESIGIDIESVDQMPEANDFREHPFYQMNFSAAEIAYCILQPQPLASFAGLFAAKEAIVKANNNLRSIPFHQLVIDHLPGGKPVHANFQLSISHTGQLAVAVAIPVSHAPLSAHLPAVAHPSSSFSLSTAIAIAALLFSLITFGLILTRL